MASLSEVAVHEGARQNEYASLSEVAVHEGALQNE
jgi:hypothetical protein